MLLDDEFDVIRAACLAPEPDRHPVAPRTWIARLRRRHPGNEPGAVNAGYDARRVFRSAAENDYVFMMQPRVPTARAQQRVWDVAAINANLA